jgi:hypothetical protein
LLGARAVAYSRLGASGILFAQLIERLGIASEVNARALIIPQGFTAERLATGEADLAVQQISHLKQDRGIEGLGPIPYELQTSRCFPWANGGDEQACRSRPVAAVSRRPRSRRRCARAGWNLEFHSLIKTTPGIRSRACEPRGADRCGQPERAEMIERHGGEHLTAMTSANSVAAPSRQQQDRQQDEGSANTPPTAPRHIDNSLPRRHPFAERSPQRPW